MQRPAKPLTSVRFRAQPPSLKITLLIENRCRAFQEISIKRKAAQSNARPYQAFVEVPCPGGGIGRRKGLKIPRWQHRAGSSPAPGTISPFQVISNRF